MFQAMYSNSRPQSDQPNFDAVLGVLQSKTTAELQNLMDNSDQIETLITDSVVIQSLKSEKDRLMQNNQGIAEYNMSVEPRLRELRCSLAGAYEKLVPIQKQYEQNKLKLDSNVSNQSLDTLLSLLKTEAAKSEENSETIATDFLAKRIDLDSFLEQYIASRTEAHTRKIKSEKLTEIIRIQNQTRSFSLPTNQMPTIPTRTAPVPPIASHHLPYPTPAYPY